MNSEKDSSNSPIIQAKGPGEIDASDADINELISGLCNEVTKKERRIKALTKQIKFLKRVVEHGKDIPEKENILSTIDPENLEVGRDDNEINELVVAWHDATVKRQ